ncbi:N-acetylmuramic acid 6-phosphate etherase [Sporohalobacter salinus]|uniref:N-acetylmuramic acid 6-phosphate etherase n=1 Tax=Sporohalobacter salinus TaxID=1494606 RepID=UPI00196200E8|nr:N-acetylmuramic acid 6-phosphate etherase [Sporohalobacter salinus]
MAEKRNKDTVDIDKLGTTEIIDKINDEDKKVALAVEKEQENIAKAVDLIVKRLKKDGRLFYIGSGTSGKLGVIDASECPPSFGIDDSMVQGIISGGDKALSDWLEHTEDDEELASKDLQDKGVTEKDIVVGITASGNTPYVMAAIKYANQIGATTIGLICNPEGKLKENCDNYICIDVGPEVIMGSTRMKAGTAQKMVLNMLSTASMIRLGKVYSNLMINVKPINEKLKKRAKEIVHLVTKADESLITEVLKKCDYDAKVATVMIKKKCSVIEARDFISKNDGVINQFVL